MKHHPKINEGYLDDFFGQSKWGFWRGWDEGRNWNRFQRVII